ncbi:hypothetical protein JHK82_018384 [Glycine max]|nr:hypothetical protein JHK86_018411 [Glycine max]KAG5142689.1 hypothetical protein JHK82_018384 [Glycine max]
MRIHDQMIMLEGAKATTKMIDALRTGATAMKAMQKAMKIDVVDKIMDEINEQTQNKRMIQETLSAPTGSTAYFDNVSVGRQPTRVVPVKATVLEEDELAALQAELAL